MQARFSVAINKQIIQTRIVRVVNINAVNTIAVNSRSYSVRENRVASGGVLQFYSKAMVWFATAVPEFLFNVLKCGKNGVLKMCNVP